MDEENKSKNFNLFAEVYKLNKIKAAMGERNPKDVENELFAEFACYTEKEKIEFEAKYIKAKLSQDKYQKTSDIESNLKIIDMILQNIDSFRLKDISKIKRYLVLIELKYDLKIGFVSEIDSIYEEKVEKMKLYNESKDTYPVDYIVSLDPEEKDNENKKRNL